MSTPEFYPQWILNFGKYVKFICDHGMVRSCTGARMGILEQPEAEGIMKQGPNRRPRPRGNPNSNKPRPSGRNSYDSTGPAGRVRGTAQQVLEKYQGLGQDALLSGDRIAAESFFQFAEHYYRIVNADADNAAVAQNSNQNSNQNNNQNTRQISNRDQPDQGHADQPEVVVNVPVVDASVEDTTPKIVVEPDVVEPVVDLASETDETPVVAIEEDAPKTPRRRRSRAKAPVDADAAEA